MRLTIIPSDRYKQLMRIATCVVVLALGVGCGKAAITETRIVQAPPRAANCPLELVTVDMTSMTFNQTWETVGFVSLSDRGAQDPNAEENRSLVRPRACAMGGTSIAVAANSTNTTAFGDGSALIYLILRPKPAAPPAPTAF